MPILPDLLGVSGKCAVSTIYIQLRNHFTFPQRKLCGRNAHIGAPSRPRVLNVPGPIHCATEGESLAQFPKGESPPLQTVVPRDGGDTDCGVSK